MFKEAQYRFTECSVKGQSSYVGFLGADRPKIADPRLGYAILIAILVGFVATHTQIG